MSFVGTTAQRWDKPDGAGPVTEADLAVNDHLHDVLRKARPDYGWLSEETEDGAERLSRRQVFIVDPIDGTRSFADGSNTWAHSIAVAEDGIVTAGVVYLPRRGLMYLASQNQGATLNGAPLVPSSLRNLNAAEVLATKANMRPDLWRGTVPGFRRAHRPSLAYRMAIVAQGRYDAMLTLRPAWEWDIAAGDLILREAGALCTDRHGAALRFNNPTPTLDGVVAAGSGMHAEILQALCPVPKAS